MLGLNFPPNPLISTILFLKFSNLIGYPYIIVTWGLVSNNIVVYIVFLFIKGVSIEMATVTHG